MTAEGMPHLCAIFWEVVHGFRQILKVCGSDSRLSVCQCLFFLIPWVASLPVVLKVWSQGLQHEYQLELLKTVYF